MDTIRTLAEERHFFTVELRLGDFGQVLLIGDEPAVERLRQIVSEHDEHKLVRLPEPLPGENRADATPAAAE